MLIPGSSGLSVASVVENRLIGIAGNSMIFPLAPGIRLDPRIDDESAPLQNLYSSNPPPPLNIAIPTRGVYAEAVQGNCTACEKIDDTRYWKWSTEGLLAPPPIAEVTTERPSGGEPTVTPTPLPAPLVSIQNAPELPNPTTLASVLGLIAKPDLFKDITGLAGTQANAQKAFNSVMTNLTAIGNDAATLAKQQLALPNTERMLDRLQSAVKDDLLSPELAQEFAEEAIRSVIGQPKEKEQLPTEDPAAQKAVKAASESKKAELKVSTPGETVEAKFEDKETRIGSAPAVGVHDFEQRINLHGMLEAPVDDKASPGNRVWVMARLLDKPTLEKQGGANVAGVAGRFIIFQSNSNDYQIKRSLRIVYPADPKDDKKIAGNGRLPVVVLLHGQARGWLKKPQSGPASFIITEQSLTNLKSESVPDDVLAKLEGIKNIQAIGEDDFKVLLKNTIGDKQAVKFESLILKHAGGPDMVLNYHGFDYLQEHLAQNDIVSVSVDVNAAGYFDSKFEMRAEMALEALDALWKLDADKDSRYFQRLNFNNVGLMGHSRSGDAVVRAARMNTVRLGSPKPQYGLKAVCSLAPSDSTGTAKEGRIYNNPDDRRKNENLKTRFLCPISLSPDDKTFYLVVYGGLDGDLSGDNGADDWLGTGFRHYDRATCERSMVYLHHCSHNRFNRIWKDDAAGKDESGLVDTEVSQGGRLRTPAEHRQLAIEYIGGIFRWRLKNETTLKGLFDGSSPNTLNLPASIQWSFGKEVIDVDTMEDKTRGTTATRKLEKEAVICRFADVRPGLKKKTAHQTGVMAVEPNLARPGTAVLKLTFAKPQDWSRFDLLTLRVTANFDLTDETTIRAGKLPEFELILTDDGGGRASIPHTQFSPAMTRPVFHKKIPKDQTATVKVTLLRLETVGVKRTSISGVNFSMIKTLEIVPPAGFPQDMFFNSLQLIKEK